MRHVQLEKLPLDNGRAPVFAGLPFATPWSRFEYLVLAPDTGREIEAARTCEHGYLVLHGQLELRDRADSCPPSLFNPHPPSRGVVLAPAGQPHALFNPGHESTRILHIGVDSATLPAAAETRVAVLDAQSLPWRDAIHGGAGRIATRHLWRPDEFASTWTYLDHTVLAAGSSLGYHYHEALEEGFAILAGQGYMTIQNHTFVVGCDSLVFQAIGEGHGIYNPGPDELEFVRIAVALPGQRPTTVDLCDDLSCRSPET